MAPKEISMTDLRYSEVDLEEPNDDEAEMFLKKQEVDEEVGGIWIKKSGSSEYNDFVSQRLNIALALCCSCRSNQQEYEKTKLDTEEEDDDDDSHWFNDHGASEKNDFVLKRLKIAAGLCCAFMLIEVVGGLVAGSLAVLSDAVHLMADLASFLVAIGAAFLAARPSTSKHTYGLKRTESLAALFSMTCLAIISIGLASEACQQIYKIVYNLETESVDGKLMSMIAAIGVLVNLSLAAVLGEHHVHLPGHEHGHDHSHPHSHSHGGDGENVNLQAAYLHVMADLAQSVAVMIAGMIIWWKPHWQIVDPIATILFCILVFYSTLGVIRASVSIILEEVPPSVDWQEIHDAIGKVKGVADVHDLHIWSISQGVVALTVHVRTTSTKIKIKHVLRSINEICKANGIQHPTIQVQPYCQMDNGCMTCGNDLDLPCPCAGECCKEEGRGFALNLKGCGGMTLMKCGY